ncbi:hypothetical protein [Micromonospora sicca]|uniref:hypothetical protein n=1 Tax=Micromonospora sicca TaxID=2202420 RepID=UPI0011B3CC5C|nr:hypothetical protein [Micromonospora sp. 4G51]
MLRKVLSGVARPDEETPGNWLEAERSRRRRMKLSWIAVLLIVGTLSWGGCTLGRAAATPLGRAQAAVVDRAAARVPMPSLPRDPHYPLSTPMPLPSISGSGTGSGALFASGEATAFRQQGLPIVFMLPSTYPWHCVVFSLPDVGASSAAEWECTEDSSDSLREASLRVLLAACSQPCDSDAVSRLRPPFALGPVRAVDDTTWLADRTTEPNLFGDRFVQLMMEHVWKAPTGAFGPGSAGESLYVAALATVPADDRATAEKIINGLRSRM